MRIDIWSDVVCPFCYLGKRRIEQAIASFPHGDEVEVNWHSFELDPAAPAVQELPMRELLAGKYGMSPEQADESSARLTAQAASLGLDFRLASARSGNTFDAHRLIHLAGLHGHQSAMKERLLFAYFTEGLAVGDPEVLARLAVEVGLDATDVRRVLDGADYGDEVRADEADAREMGITGVPFFVFDGRLAVSGAQPAEVFAQALAQAWESRAVATR